MTNATDVPSTNYDQLNRNDVTQYWANNRFLVDIMFIFKSVSLIVTQSSVIRVHASLQKKYLWKVHKMILIYESARKFRQNSSGPKNFTDLLFRQKLFFCRISRKKTNRKKRKLIYFWWCLRLRIFFKYLAAMTDSLNTQGYKWVKLLSTTCSLNTIHPHGVKTFMHHLNESRTYLQSLKITYVPTFVLQLIGAPRSNNMSTTCS